MGQTLEVRVTQRIVEVLHRGTRVASHVRCAHQGQYTTVPEHLSKAHQAHLQWTPERLIHWGQDIGMATGTLVKRMLESRPHPEHGYQACLALLVDLEVHWRSDKRQARLLKAARLKFTQACIEDIDTRAGRGLDRSAVMSLALGQWIERGHSVLITGLTGAGKTWLACSLAQYACGHGKSALYQRVPRLGEELRIRRSNGTFGKWLIALASTDVLLLDDWGMAALDSQTRSDLLEIIDDRAGNKATIITSQLPIEHWHAWIGDATVADAILDRVMQNNHRFNLAGESLRSNSQSTASAQQAVPLKSA